jgi:hypothetical protein
LLHNVAGVVDDPIPLLEPALRLRFGGRAGVGKDQMVSAPVVDQGHSLLWSFLPRDQNSKADDA